MHRLILRRRPDPCLPSCGPPSTRQSPTAPKLSRRVNAVVHISGGSVPASIIFLMAFVVLPLQAQDTLSTLELKKRSLEELMEIDVTSVSKTPEPLFETAGAVSVITHDDIRRSGARTLAGVLRLASNLQVAQVDSRQWAISARGFNSTTAN